MENILRSEVVESRKYASLRVKGKTDMNIETTKALFLALGKNYMRQSNYILIRLIIFCSYMYYPYNYFMKHKICSAVSK